MTSEIVSDEHDIQLAFDRTLKYLIGLKVKIRDPVNDGQEHVGLRYTH